MAGLNIRSAIAVFDIPASRAPRLSGPPSSRRAHANARIHGRGYPAFSSTVETRPRALGRRCQGSRRGPHRFSVRRSVPIAYDTLGRRTGLGFGDGSYQSYAWEIDGDLTAIGHAYPGRPADNVTFSYAHDRVGRVTAEQIGHAAYDYEAQIASVTYGAATAINTYPTVGSTSLQYTDAASLNPDGLHSDGAIHFASPWRYRYNARGALTNAASGGAQTRYHFDALGERFWVYHYDTSTGPQTGYYSFSDGLRPETVQEPTYSRPSNTGAWTATGINTYVLGPLPDERLIYRASDGQVYYPHTDRRGSTVALSQGGQAVHTFAYDEFGQSGPNGPSGYPFRYTGQRLDPWTGIYHYKAREYSPNLGRFLQPDPARFVDGPNMYAYVGNNPLNATDPTGLEGNINCSQTTGRVGVQCRTGGQANNPTSQFENALAKQAIPFPRPVPIPAPTPDSRSAAEEGLQALANWVGARVDSYRNRNRNNFINLDTNAIIAIMEQPGSEAGMAAMAGIGNLTPVVSPTAYNEFTAVRSDGSSGDGAALLAFIAARGGRMLQPANNWQVSRFTAMGLRDSDARIVAAGQVSGGIRTLTRDQRMVGRAYMYTRRY